MTEEKTIINKEEPVQETIKEEVKETVKEVVEETVKEEVKVEESPFEKWKPKTELGQRVKDGDIKEIDYILDNGFRIMETEIVDILLPNLESDLIFMGQSKGKFGGGKKSIWRQTQKKTKEGNKPRFSALIVVGNKDGYVGVGKGKAKETVPAREKATRQAKLNLIKIKRGAGSWESEVGEPNSVPFKIQGKCGSSKIILMSAPRGTGLVTEKECAKLLTFAGVKDVYSKTQGPTKSTLNLITACFDALKQLSKVKVSEQFTKSSGIISGKENAS
jgi:small subunit ribosomal protein S5|tara:strand:- start:5401 stop:6225 length:825 start_codon:yes stop_codon:yes gene_type:complete